MVEKRDRLIREGIIKENGQNYVFTKNYICKSASEASNIIIGAASNGMLYWKTNEGKTLGSKIRNNEDE